MRRTPTNTIHDSIAAFETSRRYANIRVDTDVARRARECKREAYEEYDIPIPENRVAVVSGFSPGGTWATVWPVGAGVVVSKPGFWETEHQPHGYIVLVNTYHYADGETKYALDTTVRHELAHAINWHEDGYTMEGVGNHARWLDRLDTE
jgi:hypothetical protein